MKLKKLIFFFILIICFLGCTPVIGASQDNVFQDSTDLGNADMGNTVLGKREQGVDRPMLFNGFLYFAEAGEGHLKALAQRFPSALNSHELGLVILETLMAGPPTSALASTFPPDTKVNALFISEDGNTWVDLGIRDGCLQNMDTVSERLAVYSLVNSLTLNIPEVKQVKILVNGSDVPSFGGHLSLKYFYKTNMLIVK